MTKAPITRETGAAGFMGRPEGDVLWVHATSETRAAALMQIVTRLHAMRPDLHLLLTLPSGVSAPQHLRPYMTALTVPGDTMPEITTFLDRWSPDLCLWTGGYLQHDLIHEAARRQVPMVLIDAEESALATGRWRLLRNRTQVTLRHFHRMLASTANAATRLLKLGVPPQNVTITGPLMEAGTALPCDDAPRDQMARLLDGRPLWLAAMVQPEELPLVTAAHRIALRSAHRRLLIIVPDDIWQGDAMTQTLRADGWRVAQWGQGERPDETSQIILADTRGEMGLWYRLAPVTFMASSMQDHHTGQDPFEPAALGSAILYGPHVSRYLTTYDRLGSAGAARMVRDPESLATGVTFLTAPDQAAAMAHAAWEVTTAGAEVTDAVMDLVQDMLDRKAAL